MKTYPIVIITQKMINEAKRFISSKRDNRTRASKIDTLIGHLRKFVFAEYFYGDWKKKHQVGQNRGTVDFNDVEIRTLAFPFSDRLNLLVREDYARKRKLLFYIQVIINVKTKRTITFSQEQRYISVHLYRQKN